MSTTTYSTGTVSIGAGSTALTGSGTAWLTSGIRAGDRLVLAGLTARIATVNSNTSITLARGWPGSAQSGADYDIWLEDDGVRSLVAANALLQALGAGTLTSLGSIAGAANLMPYWTGAGVMSTTALTAAARSLLDDTSVSAMRTTLGLGTAATATLTTSTGDTTAGRVLRVGDFGFGGGAVTVAASPSIKDQGLRSGVYQYSSNVATGGPETAAWFHTMLAMYNSAGTRRAFLDVRNTTGSNLRGWLGASGSETGDITWASIWTSANTTVDGNGFVKQASPILRLFADRTEEPVQPIGAVFTRQGVGRYRLANVEPLATAGWQIEVPQDHNGSRLVFVVTDYDAGARVLTVTTTAPAWDSAKGVWVAGEPRDIPEGRWVDLRFTEVEGAGDDAA